MKPQDMVVLLEKYGFQNLKLVKTEGKTSTFKFGTFNERNIRRTLGEPTITANKKVMVFAIPEIGRIGVSPSNDMVRFIAEHEQKKAETDTSHLGKTTVPDAFLSALDKAKVTPSLRTKWMAKMWDWFNEHKFGGRLPLPKFLCGPSFPGMPKTTRGVHQGGLNFRAGKIFLADFLFHARPAFILEVFLHEMCHQAVWNIDHYAGHEAQGHGKNWQAWMVRVGLDPRRFDPTDDVEYMSTQDARQKDAELSKLYGPRKPEAYWADKKKAHEGYVGDVIVNYKGRALEGYMQPKDRSGYTFRFRTTKGHISSLVYKQWPPATYLKETA